MILKKTGFLYILLALIVLCSCDKNKTALGIIDNTIHSIDGIETIYYKQDMFRTNPRQINDTLFRYREMYFKRLIEDSIVGVKGHWYFYSDDKSFVNNEDVYDGNRLLRINNRDSVVLLYDLKKFPEFRQMHFWGHNTLYSMQFSFKQMLNNQDSYNIVRLNDTIFMNKTCFQIEISLSDKTTMPGFATKLENSEGSTSRTLFIIDQENYYPLRMFAENYSKTNPEQKFFIDQTYYDIIFNVELDEKKLFNTSDESVNGYQTEERQP